MGRIKTTVDEPFKAVEIDMPSMRDVRCLTEAFAGAESETTAILQYIYQSYVTKELGDDWSDIFESIAISEMHHHEKLGSLIAALGGTPAICGNRSYWSGAFVNYERNLVKMIEMDIRGEQRAIEGYRRVIVCLENFSAREMIERIIKDEELHICILEEALKRAEKECMC